MVSLIAHFIYDIIKNNGDIIKNINDIINKATIDDIINSIYDIINVYL